MRCSCGDGLCGEQGGFVGFGGNVRLQQPSHGEGVPQRVSICSQLIKSCRWPQVRPTMAHTSTHVAAGRAI